jgi:PKD repeat protein
MEVMRAIPFLSAALFAAIPAFSATYNVGPGQALATIGAVPWATLQPGDTVRIHYSPTPYRQKFVICRQGTANAPITVSGVPGANGELPIIEGINATTAPGLNYWSEVRGIIKIGGANVPADTMPKYIIIEGLEIRGARANYNFTDDSGFTGPYQSNASTIFVEKCENCIIRNNILHDAGNVLFVASSDTAPSRNISVVNNTIYDGGNAGSGTEHNVYTAAAGILFEGNHMGRLLSGAVGSNLKDRSAAMVIRYNWIEGGNRQLDLVDAEDSIQIRGDANYRTAYAYGNVLIEPADDGNRQMVHYGGDGSNSANYRKGTLYFYNNTLISYRTDRTTLFRGSTNEETIDARNNVFYVTAAGNTVSLADAFGKFSLSHNWIKPGWVNSFGTFTGTVSNDGTMVTGSVPGFVDEPGKDFHLTSASPSRNTGGSLAASALAADNVVRQYVKHHATEARPSDGVLDIGAFEYSSGGIVNQPPVALLSANPISGNAPLLVNFSGAASYDPDGSIANYFWDFGDASTGSGIVPSHSYTTAGSFTALLRVTDNSGATASATRAITVTLAPLGVPAAVGSQLGNTVTLTWPAVAAATGYRVERRQGEVGAWGLAANVTSQSFSETRTAGRWDYRVRAYNAAQTSQFSKIITFRVR